MLAFDINVLIYAHRADEKTHRAYKAWLDDLVNGPQPFGLSTLVMVGFVRLVTNPRIYNEPTPLLTAITVIDQLVMHPHCRVLAPAADHWSRVRDLCLNTHVAGKLIADAQHAAIAIAEGCTWVTRDSDFSRFEGHGLTWQHLELESG